MKKIVIVKDERWPDFSAVEAKDYPAKYSAAIIEVDDSTLRRWRAAEKSYSQMQEELKKLWDSEDDDA